MEWCLYLHNILWGARFFDLHLHLPPSKSSTISGVLKMTNCYRNFGAFIESWCPYDTFLKICYEVKHQNTAPTPKHGEKKKSGNTPKRAVSAFSHPDSCNPFQMQLFQSFCPIVYTYNGALCYLAHCRKRIEYVL